MNACTSIDTNHHSRDDFPNYNAIISSVDKRNQETFGSGSNEAVRLINNSVNNRVSRNDMSNVSCTVSDYRTVNGFDIFTDNPRGGRASRNVQFE